MREVKRVGRGVDVARKVGRVGEGAGRSGSAAAPAAPVNLEQEQRRELTELQQGFNRRRLEEEKRFFAAVDSEFWVALCFESREQKEAFLRALRLVPLGDKYLDGVEAARVLGVQGALPPGPDLNRRQRKNTRFTALADPTG